MKGSGKRLPAYWELIGVGFGETAPVVIQRYAERDGGKAEALNGLERVAKYYRESWVVEVTIVEHRKKVG